MAVVSRSNKHFPCAVRLETTTTFCRIFMLFSPISREWLIIYIAHWCQHQDGQLEHCCPIISYTASQILISYHLYSNTCVSTSSHTHWCFCFIAQLFHYAASHFAHFIIMMVSCRRLKLRLYQLSVPCLEFDNIGVSG